MGFPLNSNDPYIKSTGERTTLGAAVSSGGGGEPYTLPTASAETKGGVKVGSGLTMTGEVLSADGYTLPTAAADTLGGIKVGSGLSIADGVLSATGGSGGGGGHLYKITSNNAKLKEAYLIGPADTTLTTAGDVLNYLQSNPNSAGIIVNGTGTGIIYTRFSRYNSSNFSLVSYTLAVADSAVTITVNDDEHLNTSNISGFSVTKVY